MTMTKVCPGVVYRCDMCSRRDDRRRRARERRRSMPRCRRPVAARGKLVRDSLGVSGGCNDESKWSWDWALLMATQARLAPRRSICERESCLGGLGGETGRDQGRTRGIPPEVVGGNVRVRKNFCPGVVARGPACSLRRLLAEGLVISEDAADGRWEGCRDGWLDAES